MADVVIAMSIVAAVYFYLSSTSLNDVYKKLFMYLGFAMVLGTLGLELSGESAVVVSNLIFANATIFGLLLMLDVLWIIVKVVQFLFDRAR